MKRWILSLSAFTAFILPSSMLAAMPVIYCSNLPGCGGGFKEYLTSILAYFIVKLPKYVYALGVLFVMIGGGYMVLAAGRDDMVTKGKTTITWAVIAVAVTQFTSSLLGFVFQETVSRVAGEDIVLSVTNTLMTTIFDVLYIAILGVAIFSGMRLVLAMGKDDEMQKARDGLFWCAVGAIIINLAQAIVNAFSTL